jgi:Ca2+-binding RTX toxin-like protein
MTGGVMMGGSGGDTLNGGAANSTFDAGTGDDRINGGTLNDMINAGDGNDTAVDTGGTNTINGGLGDDSLSAGAGADTLDGGDGADTLNAGAGRDVMRGGAGEDIFVIGTVGHSSTTLGQSDVIMDWNPGDLIDALGTPPTPATYAELSADDATTAQTLANAAISGGIDVVVVRVAADLIVFIDSSANNGTADDAIVLAGRSLADIDWSSFI